MIRRLAGSLMLVALVLPACSGEDNGGIDVTVSDYQVAPAVNSAPAGELTFNITNDATQTHEFVIFKTDLSADELPTNTDGDVDEEGEGVEHIDEVEDITSGSTSTLAVNLDAGSYVLVCNLPAHYRQGMHVGFMVS